MPANLHEQESDEQLAAAARGGDFGSWETFVRRHGARLLAFCVHMCGDEAAARRAWTGAVQDTWDRVNAGLAGLKPSTAAFAAATRLCAAAGPLPPARVAGDRGGFEARSQRLRQCLLALPAAERAALSLCYLDNVPYAEAQRCLGPGQPEARELCAKGYAALASALGPGFLGDGLE